MKKFLKIHRKSPEKASFLSKFACLSLYFYYKKEHHHSFFAPTFAKVFNFTVFFVEYLQATSEPLLQGLSQFDTDTRFHRARKKSKVGVGNRNEGYSKSSFFWDIYFIYHSQSNVPVALVFSRKMKAKAWYMTLMEFFCFRKICNSTLKIPQFLFVS